MTEAIDLIDQQAAPSISENDREKEQAALDSGSNILRHSALYHRQMVGTAQERLCPPYEFFFANFYGIRGGGGHAIGRAFARPGGFAHPTK